MILLHYTININSEIAMICAPLS